MTSRLRALGAAQEKTGPELGLPDAEDRLAGFIAALPKAALVVDYGCFGWHAARLAGKLGRHDLQQIGVDLHEEPPGRPDGARFLRLAAIGDALPGLEADFAIATHVIEHCVDGVAVFGTLIAAVKPGATVYVETPSEQTALVPSDPDVEGHAFTSFWDDPTHVRPWPLAALYRLALSWGAQPEDLCHAMRGDIHCSTAIIRRIEETAPRYRYVSLADVPRGVAAALAHVNRRGLAAD
ncbi:MAG TPA: methyltransferase domain-containing protein [Acidisoma sp.]|jgi:hypothetical protein|nr:methyltransferase domain-containing protein [Acidisoma sp.]